MPTAKELEKPKELNTDQNNDIYWYSKEFKGNQVPQEDQDQKKEIRNMEMQISKHIQGFKQVID